MFLREASESQHINGAASFKCRRGTPCVLSKAVVLSSSLIIRHPGTAPYHAPAVTQSRSMLQCVIPVRLISNGADELHIESRRLRQRGDDNEGS